MMVLAVLLAVLLEVEPDPPKAPDWVGEQLAEHGAGLAALFFLLAVVGVGVGLFADRRRKRDVS
jgi:hypothetical protein